MSRLFALLSEFSHEIETTRRHLETLPEEHFGWQPHPRSFTAGHLATHITECVRWAEYVFASDVFDLASYSALQPGTHIIKRFDMAAAQALLAMERSSDHEAACPWRLKMNGAVRSEKSREAAFRDLSFNHLIHHRGQLTVYLRLLGVALTGTYGPTADEHR